MVVRCRLPTRRLAAEVEQRFGPLAGTKEQPDIAAHLAPPVEGHLPAQRRRRGTQPARRPPLPLRLPDSTGAHPSRPQPIVVAHQLAVRREQLAGFGKTPAAGGRSAPDARPSRLFQAVGGVEMTLAVAQQDPPLRTGDDLQPAVTDQPQQQAAGAPTRAHLDQQPVGPGDEKRRHPVAVETGAGPVAIAAHPHAVEIEHVLLVGQQVDPRLAGRRVEREIARRLKGQRGHAKPVGRRPDPLRLGGRRAAGDDPRRQPALAQRQHKSADRQQGNQETFSHAARIPCGKCVTLGRAPLGNRA